MKISKIPNWVMLVVAIIPIIQVSTGLGVSFGGIVFGLYPVSFLYFIWLYLIVIFIEDFLTSSSKNRGVIDFSKKLILVVIVLILPFNFIYTNLLLRGYEVPYLMFISGLTYIGLLAILVNTWITISKCVFSINNREIKEIKFSHYRNMFFLFLLGPLTIIKVQKLIKKLSTPLARS